MKLKIIILSIFISVYSLFVYTKSITKDDRINMALYNQVQDLETHYNLTMDYFTKDASSIQNNISNNTKVIELFSKAQTASKEEQSKLREQLHVLLNPMYKRLQTRGILQFQFVFPDNTSFLRMHKPSKFGDDLSAIRYSFNEANKNKKIVIGFEQGRTTHAFRYVFPFYDKNGIHLGAVEVSLASFALQEKLLTVNKIHSHFLVNKQIFDAKAWETKKLTTKYTQSIEHADYMFALTKHSNQSELKKQEMVVINKIKNKIKNNISVSKIFSLYVEVGNTAKVVTFLPISDTRNHDGVAYIVSYTHSDNIYNILTEYKQFNIIIFIIMSIISYLVLRNLQASRETLLQKDKLTSLVSAYDKNVMYSKTNLEGIIIDVSEAFCKMSGYTRDELIGINHNIVRHPDNKSEQFEKLWERLQNEETFSTEVKNLKKDGSYFWVTSYFAPEYNKKGKHIGYSCVRDNITDRKEVEDLQNEIVETQTEIIYKMGAIGESRSKETGNHVKRVALYSKILATHYGLSEDEAELLREASPMHDIGKVAIPDSILKKPGRLTTEERVIMNTHSQLGFDMLHGSTRPLLNAAAIVAHEHHERWDGKGYPQGLTGQETHIYGRITAIADVFDALGSDRVYKEAWDDEKIFKLLKDERGKQFDPKLVDIFFDNLDEFLEVRDSLKENDKDKE